MSNQQAVEAFQQLVAGLEYPMFVATTSAGDQRAGCLIGFAAQCSIDPARFLACISNKNHTFRVMQGATTMAIHFLGQGDDALAELFGANTSDEIDKFSRCEWREGPDGVPVLKGCTRGWVAGRIVDRIDLGDHVGLVLEPIEGEVRNETRAQLGFQAVQHLEPGHEA